MSFPIHRGRRLRRSPSLRRLVSETAVSVENLIQPMFVVHGTGIRREIEALQGNFHLSVDRLVEETKFLRDLGIPGVLIFGLPERKDEAATEALAPDGVVQTAIRALKAEVPDMLVITDVCMCEYTPHGHCGIVVDGYVDNDRSLEVIGKIALSHVEAGADIVAPAGMLDGQVRAVRSTLEEHSHPNAVLMAYAAKYASSLYDPFFKHGSNSAVAFGDKASHQMDVANTDEAMREIEKDIQEGADIVMVKPAMFYLDIVRRAKDQFKMPLAVYNVSGEYTMIKAAAEMGRIDEGAVVLEAMMAFKRAGADIIITYFARQVASLLVKGRG